MKFKGYLGGNRVYTVSKKFMKEFAEIVDSEVKDWIVVGEKILMTKEFFKKFEKEIEEKQWLNLKEEQE